MTHPSFGQGSRGFPSHRESFKVQPQCVNRSTPCNMDGRARVLALVTHCESVCKHNGRGRSIGREFVRASAGRESATSARVYVRTCVPVCVCMFRNVQLYCRYVGPNECIAPFGHGDQRDTDPWPIAKIGILS